MPGPFPAPPIFKGKSPGDEVAASSYNANLGRTRLKIKTLLNYTRKKKRKEIQKRTERNTLHINSPTGDFVI